MFWAQPPLTNSQNPVLRYKENRALPSTFDGFMLTNTMFENVRLQASSFDKVSPRTGAGSEKLTSTYGNGSIHGDRISYVGLNAKRSIFVRSIDATGTKRSGG